MNATLVLGAASVVASIGALWWGISGPRMARHPLDAGEQLRSPVGDLRAMAVQRAARERSAQPLLTRIGRLAQRFTPERRLAALEQRLLLAGTPAGWTVERVLAAKVLLAGTAAVIGVLRFVAKPDGLGVVLAAALVAFGWFGPDLLLRHRAEKRQEIVRRTLADAIDQLTVTVQAGLGLDTAIARVSRRTRGPLGDELARVGQDIRAGMSRASALSAMAERVQVSELRQVVLALAQAERLGVPVAKTLEVQSQELRIKRRQHAEEQAMKLPVKILFPTVLCIMPALFIVVLGPAAMSIVDGLSAW
jgi:tight adherence protein C